jgi:hypothetical protein
MLDRKQWDALNASNRKAKGLWNKLNHGKNHPLPSQADKTLSYRINKPEPMSTEERVEAMDAGLTVQGQYCVTRHS